MHERILVVDDDPGMHAALREFLKSRGYDEDGAFSAEEALEKLARNDYRLVLLDVKLPGMSGLDAIPQINRTGFRGAIILMTAYRSRDTAIEAVNSGAYDYFIKPFSLKEMDVVIRRALERQKLQEEIARLKPLARHEGALSRIIGESDPMKRLKEMVQRIAPLETTVLVTGESGTGKELIADVLHSLSRRAAGPLVKINCASIPESLLESELCGHEKGAFTGAHAQRQGKFEQADGGTILMDEIGDMPFSLQAKLLRLVEQKQLERLGGKKSIDVDVRIIAATNQDLFQRIKEKQFREDLYYRLNVGAIQLPPLRERKDDLPLLVRHFLEKINVKIGTAVSGVSREGMELLFHHPWPGNIRELSNLLERACIHAAGTVLSGDDVRVAFQKSTGDAGHQVPNTAISLGQTLDEIEKNLIIEALRKCKGRQCDAAKLLGLNPKNLWKKIRKHGIERIMDFALDES
ncbi:MAG: sigma-54 dependent transcriptional regulator [Syntrophaceae bacterium]